MKLNRFLSKQLCFRSFFASSMGVVRCDIQPLRFCTRDCIYATRNWVTMAEEWCGNPLNMSRFTYSVHTLQSDTIKVNRRCPRSSPLRLKEIWIILRTTYSMWCDEDVDTGSVIRMFSPKNSREIVVPSGLEVIAVCYVLCQKSERVFTYFNGLRFRRENILCCYCWRSRNLAG